MHLTFFGHAAVGLEAEHSPAPGARLLFDPFEAGGFGGQIGYPPIDFDPDAIFLTHHHLDHSHTAPFPRAARLGPADYAARRPDLRRVAPDQRAARPSSQAIEADALAQRWGLCAMEVHHDAWGGRLRGGQSWMLRVRVDGLNVVHVGDIGELPSPARLTQWLNDEPVDLLLVTCGGYFTLGPAESHELALRLNARVTIPIHTAGSACTLPHMHPVEDFLAHTSGAKRVSNPVRVGTEVKGMNGATWVMEPRRPDVG